MLKENFIFLSDFLFFKPFPSSNFLVFIGKSTRVATPCLILSLCLYLYQTLYDQSRSREWRVWSFGFLVVYSENVPLCRPISVLTLVSSRGRRSGHGETFVQKYYSEEVYFKHWPFDSSVLSSPGVYYRHSECTTWLVGTCFGFDQGSEHRFPVETRFDVEGLGQRVYLCHKWEEV